MLDKGAYCGEGGFFAQMAAMHALGPYELENVHVESSLVYSNNQPSSSIRAPTAPQVCWALEQHMDELAEALGIDPVELRRRTLIEEGSVTADRPGARADRDEGDAREGGRADRLRPGAARRTRRSASPCGWWPCFAANAGAYVKLNPDGTGTIVTGAQENGTGAVMAMPTYVAEELGMKPEDFSILYQDTDAAPWDMGSCGSQTTFNSARAVIAAAVDVRDQLLDAAAEQLEAARERPRARRGHRPRQGLAREVGHDRRPRRVGARSTARARASCRRRPTAPAEGCVGRLGLESFHAPQLIAHAVRVKVDRGTGVVRVLQVAAAHDCGRILNRIGADGQVYGGVVMGIGQALSEGTQLDDDGRHRNAHLTDYKLVTASDAPQIDIAWIETDTPNAGPKGSKGVGEPPCVPTAGAIANAIAKVIGARVHALPMTPERVWEAGAMSVEPFVTASTRRRGASRALAARRAPGRRRHRPRRRRALRERRRCRTSLVAIHRVAELHGIDVARTERLRLGALVDATRRSPRSADVRARLTALADACAIVGSHATRAQGTIGGNLMNASPAMETGGPLVCFERDGDAASRRPGRATVAVADLFTGPGSTVAEPGRAARRDPTSPLPPPAPEAPTCGSSTAGRWRSPSSGATAVVTRRRTAP